VRPLDEVREHAPGQMRPQRARPLVGSIEHHPEEPGPGEVGDAQKRRIAVGEQHRDQSHARSGERFERPERAVEIAREHTDLDDVDGRVRHRPHACRHHRWIQRQIADGGAQRPPSAETAYGFRERGQRPGAQGPFRRVLEVEDVGTAGESEGGFVDVGDAREQGGQGRASIGLRATDRAAAGAAQGGALT
jgi:hypothetical protein